MVNFFGNKKTSGPDWILIIRINKHGILLCIEVAILSLKISLKKKKTEDNNLKALVNTNSKHKYNETVPYYKFKKKIIIPIKNPFMYLQYLL